MVRRAQRLGAGRDVKHPQPAVARSVPEGGLAQRDPPAVAGHDEPARRSPAVKRGGPAHTAGNAQDHRAGGAVRRGRGSCARSCQPRGAWARIVGSAPMRATSQTAHTGLLLVHAHPDDETIGSGATMARYARAWSSRW